MPIIEHVIEVEFLLTGNDKGCKLTHLNPHTGKQNAITFDVESIAFDTPVKSHGHAEGFFFKPDKPLACWIEPHLGMDMRCDTMEHMKTDQWHEKERKSLANEDYYNDR